MVDYSEFSLGKKKDNFLVNLDKIKGGLKAAALDNQSFSIFKSLVDSDENSIIDKTEIDKFIEEIKLCAKDNNFSMREAAKYLEKNQLKNIKPEQLFKFIENLTQASENIEESSVITDTDGKKTVFIKYKDNSEETIYPDKTSKQVTTGENNEIITRELNEKGVKVKETILYNDKSKKVTTFTDGLPDTETIEQNETVTTVKFENNFPKLKTIKSGETVQEYEYINGEEKLIYSKSLKNKKWIEEKYKYNEKAQLLHSEIKRGDDELEEQSFEYHSNGQISSKTKKEIATSDISFDEKSVTITYDESGKRLKLTNDTHWKYKDMELSNHSEFDFDKNGNITGYIPRDTTLDKVLKSLKIEKGTELYDKFMELNKNVIKSYRNGKVLSFDVGAKITIPGEVEDKALYFTGVDPKYEKESYNREHLGNADVHGIPTETYKVEKSTSWWELAKQNLINLGIQNPTKEQIAKQMNILITLNDAQWSMDNPVEAGREVIFQAKESDKLPEIYKKSTYNIENLKKKYPASKYTIKKTAINAGEKTDWGEDATPIYGYHVFDKSTGKKIMSVIPNKEIYSKDFTVIYFDDNGKKYRELKFVDYDKNVSEIVYKNGTEYKSTYDSNGVQTKLEYLDPKSKRIISIDHPQSPDKTIIIKKNEVEFEETRYYKNGKLYVKQVKGKEIYYDKNGKEQYTTKWEEGRKNLRVSFPAANDFARSLKSSDGKKAVEILNNLDIDSYKMFLMSYAQLKNTNDPIKDIQNSNLDAKVKNQLIGTLRNLINEDCKITKFQRTETGKTGQKISTKLNGDILTVTNHTTGKTHTIDFSKRLSKCTEFEKARLKKLIVEKLPLEVIEDFAIENRELNVSMDTHVLEDNPDWEAAGQYFAIDDSITLMAPAVYGKGEDKVGYFKIHSADFIDKDLMDTITHEIGHAIDYNGYLLNTHSTAKDEFIKAFEADLEAYKKAGKKQYSYDKDFKAESSIDFDEKTGKLDIDSNTVYGTANEKEMFAECYTLMMLGDCQSKDHIEKYFKRTFNAARKLLAEIRNMDDFKRCNPYHV